MARLDLVPAGRIRQRDDAFAALLLDPLLEAGVDLALVALDRLDGGDPLAALEQLAQFGERHGRRTRQIRAIEVIDRKRRKPQRRDVRLGLRRTRNARHVVHPRPLAVGTLDVKLAADDRVLDAGLGQQLSRLDMERCPRSHSAIRVDRDNLPVPVHEARELAVDLAADQVFARPDLACRAFLIERHHPARNLPPPHPRDRQQIGILERNRRPGPVAPPLRRQQCQIDEFAHAGKSDADDRANGPSHPSNKTVTPAQAGAQAPKLSALDLRSVWVPAFAGMTFLNGGFKSYPRFGMNHDKRLVTLQASQQASQQASPSARAPCRPASRPRQPHHRLPPSR